jgi:hypothetical protein
MTVRRATDFRRYLVVGLVVVVTATVWLAARADEATEVADNTLTPQEQRQGWVLLFDGQSADGWLVGDGEAVPVANVQDGAINPHKVGAGRKVYLMYTKHTFGDFVLSLDFKVTERCNSGVFFRVGDSQDPVQTGLEMQVYDSAGKPVDGEDGKYSSCGAIYGALAPSADAMKPAGEWNHAEITAKGANVTVVLNGRQVIDMDLDRWTAAGRNPDGTENKFKSALKNFPRAGHIGLQDHNHDVWFKNIKVRALDDDRDVGPR